MVKSCSSVTAIAHCFILVLWHHCPCLFLVSAFPLCHWQGVEKLVHYFCDKAWYSTTSDFFSSPHAFSLLFFCPMHDACLPEMCMQFSEFSLLHRPHSPKYYREKTPLFNSAEVLYRKLRWELWREIQNIKAKLKRILK